MKKALLILSFCICLIAVKNTAFSQMTSSPSNHKLAILLAGSVDMNEKKFGFSPALMYEYQFPNTDPKIGLGVIGTFDLYTNPSFGGNLAFYYHPSKNLRLFFAPGIKMTNYKNPVPNERLFFSDTISGTKMYIDYRIGINYDFYYKRMTISPCFSADMFNKKSILSLGANIAYNF